MLSLNYRMFVVKNVFFPLVVIFYNFTLLLQAGRQTPRAVNQHPYSSSDVQLVSDIITAGKPIPLALDQIKTEVIDRFVYAAKVAYETGLCSLIPPTRIDWDVRFVYTALITS